MRNATLIQVFERSVFALRAKIRHGALSRIMRSCRGSAAVEMALIAPVFFTLMVGLTEMTLMMTAQQLMESAAYNTSRLAKTGYAATGMTQMETVSQVLNQQLAGLGSFIDLTQVTMTSKAYETFASIGSGAGSEGLGTPEQIVVYTVTYPWKFLTPMIGSLIGAKDANGNWVVNIQSRIVVRNEPYS